MKTKGFTLIELLIVVAIIAILAAIAVPNFLEAQTRSKVARIKADLRTVSIALESYCIDQSKYPHLRGYYDMKYSQWDRGSIGAATSLTTPVAYLSSVMINDPFYKKGRYYSYGIEDPVLNSLSLSICVNYVNVGMCRAINKYNPVDDGRPKWFLLSVGPDQLRGPDPRGPQYTWGVGSYATDATADKSHRYDAWNYDPTNGTYSGGDILYHP